MLRHRAPEPTLCPLGQPEKAIGHESLIEPWLALTTELLVGFRTDWLRRQEAMKTAGRGTQTRYATVRSEPSSWSGRLEQILLNHAGWKARKNPAAGRYFFLTFPFIELIGTKSLA